MAVSDPLPDHDEVSFLRGCLRAILAEVDRGLLSPGQAAFQLSAVRHTVIEGLRLPWAPPGRISDEQIRNHLFDLLHGPTAGGRQNKPNIWALGKPLHAKSDDDICRIKGFNRGLNHPEDVVPDRHHGAYDEGVAFGVLVGLGILHG